MRARDIIEGESPKRAMRALHQMGIDDDALSAALETNGFENNGARWIYGRYAPNKLYVVVTRHAQWSGSGVLRQAEEDPEPQRTRPYDLWNVMALKQPRGVYAKWPVAARHLDLRSEQVPEILAKYGIQLNR